MSSLRENFKIEFQCNCESDIVKIFDLDVSKLSHKGGFEQQVRFIALIDDDFRFM